MARPSSSPASTDATGVRGFLGLANQLGFLLPDLAQSTKHLRELTQKNNAFVWLDVHDQDFYRTRRLLTSKLVVHR